MFITRPVAWVGGGHVREIVKGGAKLYYRFLCYVIIGGFFGGRGTQPSEAHKHFFEKILYKISLKLKNF